MHTHITCTAHQRHFPWLHNVSHFLVRIHQHQHRRERDRESRESEIERKKERKKRKQTMKQSHAKKQNPFPKTQVLGKGQQVSSCIVVWCDIVPRNNTRHVIGFSQDTPKSENFQFKVGFYVTFTLYAGQKELPFLYETHITHTKRRLSDEHSPFFPLFPFIIKHQQSDTSFSLCIYKDLTAFCTHNL